MQPCRVFLVLLGLIVFFRYFRTFYFKLFIYGYFPLLLVLECEKMSDFYITCDRTCPCFLYIVGLKGARYRWSTDGVITIAIYSHNI